MDNLLPTFPARFIIFEYTPVSGTIDWSEFGPWGWTPSRSMRHGIYTIHHQGNSIFRELLTWRSFWRWPNRIICLFFSGLGRISTPNGSMVVCRIGCWSMMEFEWGRVIKSKELTGTSMGRHMKGQGRDFFPSSERRVSIPSCSYDVNTHKVYCNKSGILLLSSRSKNAKNILSKKVTWKYSILAPASNLRYISWLYHVITLPHYCNYGAGSIPAPKSHIFK